MPSVYSRLRELMAQDVTVQFVGPHIWVKFDERELLYRHEVSSEAELIIALGHALEVVEQTRAPLAPCWIEASCTPSR